VLLLAIVIVIEEMSPLTITKSIPAAYDYDAEEDKGLQPLVFDYDAEHDPRARAAPGISLLRR
jgi:hypothetical protein